MIGLDRLIRGRGWIAIVATALIGIVYLQVSLLSMNQTITRAVRAQQSLEASNTVLQGQIAQDAAGGRIQDVAAREGMVMPPAMWSSYVTVGRSDAARGAHAIVPPDPAAEQRNAAANAALAPPVPTLGPQISGATPAAIAPTADTAAAAVAAVATQATATDTATAAAATGATPTAAPTATVAPTATPTTTAAPPPAPVAATAAPVTSTPVPTQTPVSAAVTTGSGGVSAGP